MHKSSPSSTWPSEELEDVTACPVCGCEASDLLYRGLVDLLFDPVPGAWDLAMCAACGSGYLNPRPTRASLGRAYSNYYTHADAKGAFDSTFADRVRRRLQYGYLNKRYGYRLAPASAFGPLAARLNPSIREHADRIVRRLDRPSRSATLLDIGCGNGAFLGLMQWQGWDVMGIDADEQAVDTAKGRGVPARVGTDAELDTFPTESFDAITIHHVLEHCHDPCAALVRAYGILKPGGHIWVASPNLDSIGHRHFKLNWRGLEPPRHLVLFTASSLRAALVRAGFEIVGSGGGWQAAWYFKHSDLIAVKAGAAPRAAVRLRVGALVADLRAWRQSARREEISFLAQRPKTDPTSSRTEGKGS